MPAKTPEEVDHLFVKFMSEGDVESVLNLYDPEIAFVNRDGEIKRGVSAIREELAQFAASKQVFNFNLKRVVLNGNIALVHNHWEMISPHSGSGYAIEVMRRQPDAQLALLHRGPIYRRRNKLRNLRDSAVNFRSLPNSNVLVVDTLLKRRNVMSLAQISTVETKAPSTTQSRNGKIQRIQMRYEEIGSGVASIHLNGRLDILGVDKIDLRFATLTATQRKSVIVDLRDVELIVSVGLGLLITNANALKAHGKIMILLNPQPRVERVIRIAGLEELLPIEFSLTDALKRIKANENQFFKTSTATTSALELLKR